MWVFNIWREKNWDTFVYTMCRRINKLCLVTCFWCWCQTSENLLWQLLLSLLTVFFQTTGEKYIHSHGFSYRLTVLNENFVLIRIFIKISLFHHLSKVFNKKLHPKWKPGLKNLWVVYEEAWTNCWANLSFSVLRFLNFAY